MKQVDEKRIATSLAGCELASSVTSR